MDATYDNPQLYEWFLSIKTGRIDGLVMDCQSQKNCG